MKQKLNLFIIVLASLPVPSLGSFAFVAPTTKNVVPPSRAEGMLIQQPQEKQLEQPCYMPPELLPPLENRPAISTQRLSRMDIQRAIADVKRFMENRLEQDLNLIPVSCCLVLEPIDFHLEHLFLLPKDDSCMAFFRFHFCSTRTTAHGSIGIHEWYRRQ
jgi:hypothetical protein